jgi:hypothetical protein
MGSLWPRSGTIERYADDIRAAGAKAYFYQGGTTSPLTVYGDSGEGESLPFPVLADATGRWPDIFIPYSSTGYDVQVKTADNVQLTYTQSIPNPNPIAVAPPPATDGLQTGMIHPEFVNATKAGFVRLNGRTLGNATSGATERANADTANLFTYLWNSINNNIAPVSGGRGGSAAADYAANKTIVLPPCQGTTFVGLDDMGNTAAGQFAAQSFASGHGATVQGSACGGNSRTLTLGNLPAHTHTAATAAAGSHNHTGSTGSESAHTHTGTTGAGSAHSHGPGTLGTDTMPNHTHGLVNGAQVATSAATGGQVNPGGTNMGFSSISPAGAHNHAVTTGTTASEASHTHNFTTDAGSSHLHSISSDGTHTHTITVDPVGSGTAVDNMPNSRLVTWFIKL